MCVISVATYILITKKRREGKKIASATGAENRTMHQLIFNRNKYNKIVVIIIIVEVVIKIVINICYSPEKLCPRSRVQAEDRTRDRGHSFSQYGPTKAGE